MNDELLELASAVTPLLRFTGRVFKADRSAKWKRARRLCWRRSGSTSERRIVRVSSPAASNSDAIHLFFQINREHGTTLIVVTHNPAFAERMPRVVRMVDGRVEADELREVAPH